MGAMGASMAHKQRRARLLSVRPAALFAPLRLSPLLSDSPLFMVGTLPHTAHCCCTDEYCCVL